MFKVLILLGLAVNIESGAGENASDIGLTIIFFLAFFGSIIVLEVGARDYGSSQEVPG
jgi:hypothetical protein